MSNVVCDVCGDYIDRPNRQHLTLLKAYSVQFSIIREMLQAEHPRSDARSMVHVNVAIERED